MYTQNSVHSNNLISVCCSHTGLTENSPILLFFCIFQKIYKRFIFHGLFAKTCSKTFLVLNLYVIEFLLLM